jgi:5-hydroxyisourate hydrolase
MGISTHVLDTAKGRPAAGLGVTLSHGPFLAPPRAPEMDREGWVIVARGVTDAEGRIKLVDEMPEAGLYRIAFDTDSYNLQGFFPRVVIEFMVETGVQHYHVPLLLSPFGYSTYRGS